MQHEYTQMQFTPFSCDLARGTAEADSYRSLIHGKEILNTPPTPAVIINKKTKTLQSGQEHALEQQINHADYSGQSHRGRGAPEMSKDMTFCEYS